MITRRGPGTFLLCSGQKSLSNRIKSVPSICDSQSALRSHQLRGRF
uniref:Uncharacterized protein n=1 Tax=Siphoviridae sp. ct2u94 TaxID=2826277 RepID=A0A8S5QWJ9_9CAUD|nr:MAG TPA: hypothetical protein [Siphoviridae sp. ct2u94]